MGAETQRKRFPPSIEVERVVSHVRPAIESTPLRLEPSVNGSAEYKELRKLVGPWGLEPQASTVSI
jgi:hypothetical protein